MPYPCTFCNSGDKKYPRQDHGKVFQEVKYLDGLGIEELFFFDDLFNLNNKRVFEFCELLAKSDRNDVGLQVTGPPASTRTSPGDRGAGCERIHFGLETHTDESLRALKKQITVEQIRARRRPVPQTQDQLRRQLHDQSAGDTREDDTEKIGFANALDLDYNQFGVLIAFRPRRSLPRALRRDTGRPTCG